MGSFDFLSMEDFLELPTEVMDEMLEAGAAIVAEEQSKKANELLGEKGSGPGTTADSVHVNKPKTRHGGREIHITFHGTRPNGPNQNKRNAEVAFINEFGVGNPKKNARQFVRLANEAANDRATDAEDKIYQEWLESQ